MTDKANTTKAQPEKPEGEGTKLAQVENPAKLTDKKIKDITKDDGTDEPENSANKDAAETLKKDRAEAKGKGDEDKEGQRAYFSGQGGGQGI